jgi:uncharacterized membrane protein
MDSPPSTAHGRLLGWRAPALRRLTISGVAGIVAGLALSPFVGWQLAVLSGWDLAAIVILVSVGVVALGADAACTEEHAVREDESRDTARIVMLSACVASLLAVGFALGLAKQQGGAERVADIVVATATVVLSWAVVNTVFTLRYAHLYYRSPDHKASLIDFNESGSAPDYRDFAYLSFTIGMTYQVSDTALRDRVIRHEVLLHALLSYVYGVAIVATAVNIIASLIG